MGPMSQKEKGQNNCMHGNFSERLPKHNCFKNKKWKHNHPAYPNPLLIRRLENLNGYSYVSSSIKSNILQYEYITWTITL